MAKQYDRAAIERMLPTERHNLWANAKRLGTTSALAVAELVEKSGLDYRANASVRLDDAIGKQMERIIFSVEGREAAVQATRDGLPALSGVDPLLRAALGADYGKHNEATVQAGYLVAKLMQQLGYNDGPAKPLPSGCVASTGKMFAKRPAAR